MPSNPGMNGGRVFAPSVPLGERCSHLRWRRSHEEDVEKANGAAQHDNLTVIVLNVVERDGDSWLGFALSLGWAPKVQKQPNPLASNRVLFSPKNSRKKPPQIDISWDGNCQRSSWVATGRQARRRIVQNATIERILSGQFRSEIIHRSTSRASQRTETYKQKACKKYAFEFHVDHLRSFALYYKNARRNAPLALLMIHMKDEKT
jgi:hypothetical protein